MVRRPPGFRFKILQKLSDRHNIAMTVLYGQRFLEAHPTHVRGWCLVGKALVDLGRYEEAKQAYTSALVHWPEEHRGYPLLLMGTLFRRAGDYDQAAAWFRRARDADPGEATYLIYLGGVLARQGNLEEAEATYRAATACPEGCIDEAYLNLGFILRAQERYEEAAECFREAIRLDPVYRPAIVALRDVERCQTYLEKHPPDPEFS